MKKVICLGAVLLFASTGMAAAPDGKLHGSLELSYLSSYIWRGFDVYGPGSHSGIEPALTLDLYGTGFGLQLKGHRAISGKYENAERWDYSVFYRNMLFAEERYATAYHLGFVYYNFPDMSRKDIDLAEIQTVLSFPKILGVEGLVPSYALVKLWPGNSGSLVASKFDVTIPAPSRGTASGFAHIFMLDYGMPIKPLLPNQTSQTLRLHTELVFNDGVGPAGQNADHDWSNIVFGVATDFELGNNFSFTPALYYQVSMDDSVNDEDETWATMAVKYEF